jgi:hypothetical protein
MQIVSDKCVFAVTVLVSAVVIGCTTIDAQVEGFPQDLEVRVHKNVGLFAVTKKCWEHLPTWRKLLGSVCTQVAWIDLNSRTCDIYTTAGDATEHEVAHCRGGDHDGQLQAFFDQYRGIK